jgi:uncharacterized protein YjbJ (UPF0337 family)
MNKDTFEGAARSAVGQGERIVGQAMGDKGTAQQGYYDDAVGKARSALGSAKDAVNSGVDAVSAIDFAALRDQIAQLTQKVSELATTENLSQTAADAQDKFVAIEGDVESRIKKNPVGAVAVALLIGLLIGKMM